MFLNYVTIAFSVPVLNRKTFFFKKVSCLYYVLSQRFLYLMTIHLPKMGNNLLEEINPQRDYIVLKNTCFQQIFMRAQKRVNKFFDCKRIWKTRCQQYPSSSFCFCMCCCFSYQYFPFLECFLIFHWQDIFSRYIFTQSFKNICQMRIFVIVYLPKEYLLNKQSVSLCKLSKT